jgi:hypothetical protein
LVYECFGGVVARGAGAFECLGQQWDRVMEVALGPRGHAADVYGVGERTLVVQPLSEGIAFVP